MRYPPGNLGNACDVSAVMKKLDRDVVWDDPFASLALAKGRSGLELLTAVLNGTYPAPPMAALMNLRLAEVEHGRVVFEGDPGEEHYNPVGVVHGGFALTLLDSALGCSVHSALPPDAIYGTIDVHARLVRPIKHDTGTVRCEATVVSITRSLGTAEARIVDRAGTLLATGTTACAIRRPE